MSQAHRTPEGDIFARLVCDERINRYGPLASLVAIAREEASKALETHVTLRAAADQLGVSPRTMMRIRDALQR